MASKDNPNEVSSSGTIVINVPPKPKFELFLGVVILTAAVLFIVTELNGYNKQVKSYGR